MNQICTKYELIATNGYKSRVQKSIESTGVTNSPETEKYQQNEIVMLILGVGVLIFTIINRAGLRRLPSCGILMTAFYLLLATWVATVLEDFIWNNFFNLLY